MSAPTPPRDPDPLDEAIAAFREMPVPPHPADDARVARVIAGRWPAVELAPPSRRRTLMRIASLSAAAALVAVAVGVTTFLVAPASIALGDVLKAAEQHKLVKYSMVQHVETKDGSSILPAVQVAYADVKAPRYRTDNRGPGLQGALDFESVYVQDGIKGVTMHRITEVVTEKGKNDPESIKLLERFERLGVPRKSVTFTDLEGDLTPATADKSRSILENLRALEKHKEAVAIKAKLQGEDVLKYRIEEGLRTTVLWVNAATKLPVRLEYETTDPKDLHPTTTGTKYILSDFEWDPELKGFKDIDELFSTAPPAGYWVEDLRKEDDKAGH